MLDVLIANIYATMMSYLPAFLMILVAVLPLIILYRFVKSYL